jgi:iron complex outermembrane recepter protein
MRDTGSKWVAGILTGLSALTATVLVSSDALADESAPAKENFNISSQPVSRALRTYALQTGDQVVYFSEVAKSRASAAVSGQFTRDEALRKLLQNTGLTYQRLNTRTIAISSSKPDNSVRKINDDSRSMMFDSASRSILLAQSEAAAPQAEPAPAPAPAEQSAEDQSLFSMTEVVVTGTASKERTKYESSVAISTFDAADIQQQAPKSTADLISAVPGFWVESTAGTTQGNVFARGIIQDGGYRYVGLMEDGLPIYPVFELSFYNPDQFVRVDETVSRVEALRGGTAPIFTAGAVGGAVNFVTQTPGTKPVGTLKATVGDFGMYRADAAWSGPINDTWGLAVGGYYRESKGVRDPGYDADKGGQIRLKATRNFDEGSLELFGKYINDRSMFVVPIPLQGDPSDPKAINGQDPGTYSLSSEDLARAPLPPSAAEVGLAGSDLRNGIHPDLYTIGGKLQWNFNNAVTLTNIARFTDGEVRFDGIFPGDPAELGTSFAGDAGVAPNYTVISTGQAYSPTQFVQNHGHWVVNKEYTAFQNDARVNFAVEAHDFAVGLYYADYEMSDRWSLGNLLLMTVGDRPSRLFLPGATDPNGFTQYSFFNLAADYDATSYALYATDEWKVTDALRLDFGVRYDKEDVDASISNGTTVNLDGNPATPWDNATALAGTARTNSSPSFNNTGYSLGFNYEFTKQHAVFGHYTESAKLPHFDDIRGGSNQKDKVNNIEVGYKTALNQLAFFATLFQTEFDNVFFNDILADGSTARRFAKTRTRGIELEGAYQPTDILSVNFSITQQDPKYRDFIVRNAQTGAISDFTDNRIRRIPKTMVRLTPTLSFLENRGRVYLSYSHAGSRFANDENSIELPSYDKLDAGVLYDWNDRTTFQLTGDNLTDEVGLTEGNPRTDVGSGGIGAVYNARPLFGRSFQASVTVKF